MKRSGKASKIEPYFGPVRRRAPCNGIPPADGNSGFWPRWGAGDFDAARTWLARKPAAEYTLDDWMLSVDYLIEKYLPSGVIESDADYLKVRDAIFQKIQKNMSAWHAQSVDELLALGRAVPTMVRGEIHWLNAVERATIEFANAHAAANIAGLDESARRRMRELIAWHVASTVLGTQNSRSKSLASQLFRRFATLNLDFEHIARSELADCFNQGFIAAQPIGGKVEWIEPFRSACSYCAAIGGKTFTVVAPDKLDKDSEREVWVGKTDICGVWAAKERGENACGELREDDWSHVVRGRWRAISEPGPGIDPKFEARLQEAMKRGRPGTP